MGQGDTRGSDASVVVPTSESDPTGAAADEAARLGAAACAGTANPVGAAVAPGRLDAGPGTAGEAARFKSD
ncbi:hypothetical protein OJ998_28980, partial [Solirubrobacter taibaiensis]|nr:hypothetical protein [Solirubrobacter taibaiensis]